MDDNGCRVSVDAFELFFLFFFREKKMGVMGTYRDLDGYSSLARCRRAAQDSVASSVCSPPRRAPPECRGCPRLCRSDSSCILMALYPINSTISISISRSCKVSLLVAWNCLKCVF